MYTYYLKHTNEKIMIKIRAEYTPVHLYVNTNISSYHNISSWKLDFQRFFFYAHALINFTCKHIIPYKNSRAFYFWGFSFKFYNYKGFLNPHVQKNWRVILCEKIETSNSNDFLFENFYNWRFLIFEKMSSKNPKKILMQLHDRQTRFFHLMVNQI